ncbi:MAG: hypothetical protein J0H52_08140, partial [Comamonadaceae bacterium]|nr:hypothetical protein [Comamonadaceae bacterium]
TAIAASAENAYLMHHISQKGSLRPPRGGSAPKSGISQVASMVPISPKRLPHSPARAARARRRKIERRAAGGIGPSAHVTVAAA